MRSTTRRAAAAALALAALLVSCRSTKWIEPIPPTATHPDLEERLEHLDRKLAGLDAAGDPEEGR